MKLVSGLVVAERFRLVRPLGQGGMGAVWLAQHTGLDIPCAMKFIHEQAAESGELRARFEREAKAAASLRSPHVVQILDHGVWQGSPYIAMEFLEGEDLGQRLQRVRVLPAREVVAVAMQVGRALSKAHAAGLVHRDLKPANIFLVRDEDREIAKVLDFGVAKLQEAGIDGTTKTGAVLGTPFYMSPEQARGSRSIDHRSDLWALAVVVYQAVTGKLPFSGESLGDLFVKIIVEPLPVPSAVGPHVPAAFDQWWSRAAARDPAARYQTAKELTDGLALALGVTVGAGVEVGSSMASVVGPPPALVSSGGTIALTPSQPVTSHPSGPYAALTSPGTPPHPSGPYAALTSPGTPPYQSGPYAALTSPGTPYQSGPYAALTSLSSPGVAFPTPPPDDAGPPSPGAADVTRFPGTPVPSAAPTTQQALPVREAPQRSRTGLVAAVVAVFALGGAGVGILAWRSSARNGAESQGPARGVPAATADGPEGAPASAPSVPAPTASAPAAPTTASAQAEQATTPKPSADASIRPAAAPGARAAGKTGGAKSKSADFGF